MATMRRRKHARQSAIESLYSSSSTILDFFRGASPSCTSATAVSPSSPSTASATSPPSCTSSAIATPLLPLLLLLPSLSPASLSRCVARASSFSSANCYNLLNTNEHEQTSTAEKHSECGHLHCCCFGIPQQLFVPPPSQRPNSNRRMPAKRRSDHPRHSKP